MLESIKRTGQAAVLTDDTTAFSLVSYIYQVDIEKYFSFGCSCSEAAYLTQRKAFYESHVTVDDFIEVQETFHLAGKSQLCDVGRDGDSTECCSPFILIYIMYVIHIDLVYS